MEQKREIKAEMTENQAKMNETSKLLRQEEHKINVVRRQKTEKENRIAKTRNELFSVKPVVSKHHYSLQRQGTVIPHPFLPTFLQLQHKKVLHQQHVTQISKFLAISNGVYILHKIRFSPAKKILHCSTYLWKKLNAFS